MQDHQVAVLAASSIVAVKAHVLADTSQPMKDDVAATEVVRLAAAILIEMRKQKLTSGAQAAG